MERFFEGFDAPTAFGDLPADWTPKVDVVEKNGVLTVSADLPGMTAKDVNVELTGDRLTIKGERKSDVEETKAGVYRRERTYGAFLRTLPVPEGITPEQIKATFANGVLEVTLPLPPAITSKSHRIEVGEPKPIAAKTAA
jgi:HSP20 family protein